MVGLPYSHDMNTTVPCDNGYKKTAYYDPKPGYFDVPLMRNNEMIERPVDHRTLTKRYTDEAVQFIQRNRDRPFFLYLAHKLPQIPLNAMGGVQGAQRGGFLWRHNRRNRRQHRSGFGRSQSCRYRQGKPGIGGTRKKSQQRTVVTFSHAGGAFALTT
jgi:hypothetical protein